MLNKLHQSGLTSEMMYTAGVASIGISMMAWAASMRKGSQGLAGADRWAIFVGEWAPTFFALGAGLRLEEENPSHKRR